METKACTVYVANNWDSFIHELTLSEGDIADGVTFEDHIEFVIDGMLEDEFIDNIIFH